MEILIVVILGFILDLIFGDPHWLYHPICLIGSLIKYTEKFLRFVFPKTKTGELIAGIILNMLVLTVTFCVPFFILYFLRNINIYLALGIETIFCYQILATKSLKKESMRVHKYLKIHDIENSRKYLSWIVGRDTKELDETAITKAAVETVAENTTDGVIAPLIFMLIGGAPLAFMYKGVNTLDSMVGYKNDKYINFGKFSAIIDDIFNFIPAYLSAIIMIISSFIVGLDSENALKIFLRDKRNHASPNSAKTESVCAGALNIQLAGDAYYFGVLHKKKTIGDNNRPVVYDDIKIANKLMYATAILSLIIFSWIRLLFIIML